MMPAIPNSFFITKQMKQHIERKTIKDFVFCNLDRGRYNLFDISKEQADPFKGGKIMSADSNFIATDGGWLCEFGYADGGLRYFENAGDCGDDPAPKSSSGGVTLKFLLHDGSALRLCLDGWCCRLGIRRIEATNGSYPFRNKFPLEVADKNDFTYENYTKWLDSNGTMPILEVMALAKGATDIRTSMMNYILWQSGLHPKKKANKLTENEKRAVYDNTAALVDEYISEKRICFHTDIFGRKCGEDDESLTLFTSRSHGKPCPKCAAPIEFVAGGGTKLYYCPNCQPK
ncbi:MAG: hypothetical protein FWG34_10050 [Oscillospiraceae bacterium]|nr:hypothetical protein [Oscillospiraceae bacterium]